MFNKRLLKEFPDNWKYVAWMVAAQWICLLLNVFLMSQTASLIASVVGGEFYSNDALRLVVAFVIVFILRAIWTTVNSRMSFAASTNVKRKLRKLIYEKLTRLGSSYRDSVATSEAVQLSTEGVDQLEIYFAKYVSQFFYSMLAPLTLFVIVGSMSIKVAAILLICVPLIPMAIVAVQKFAKKLLAKYWGAYTGLGDTFLENLQGLTTMKIYQTDEYYAKKMDEEAESFRKVTMRVLIMQLNSISIMDLVAYGGAAIGIVLSVLQLRAGNITLPECFFIIMISAEFFLPMRQLGSFFHIAMNGNAAADKIFKLLDTPEPSCGTIYEIPHGGISFNNAGFSYTSERQTLKNISFELPEKGFAALVGVSGCGKSTVASIIMGEHKLEDGTAAIGGIPVQNIARETLQKKVTRVRSDSYIFKGTVRENLLMGNENASADDMHDALRRVDLYDTIMEKGGLSMELTEKASNLSGGQKQRLAIARALLHDSDIYIFDEATSNIDAESENKIMQVIHELAHKKTVLLISHRLANVVDADGIFVMQDGKITENGTHIELLTMNGYYSQLFNAQQDLEKYAREAV